MVDPQQQEFEQQEFKHQIAPQKVALFERQFGEEYRLLAYHAALPLVLTPELVHYLRTEFLLDLVPWESEADLLLSDLCSQVGYELYAMDTAVRSYLLKEMQQDDRIPPDRMQSVANVLMSYVLYLSRINPGQRERELQVQKWAAMAYLGDEDCRQMADEIAEQFEASGGQGNSTAVKAEFARLARITQELEPQLQAHPELVEFARRVGQAFHSPQTLTSAEWRQAFVVGDRRLQLPREGATDPELQILNFRTARFVDPGAAIATDDNFPPIQTESFTITTIIIEPDRDVSSIDLQPFTFTVATLQRNPTRQYDGTFQYDGTVRYDGIGGWAIRSQQSSGYHFFDTLSLPGKAFLEMVSIPGGKFLMGSPESEPNRQSNESPQHKVTVEPFLMGRYPITQIQWQVVAQLMPEVNRELKPSPSRFSGSTRPVEKVRWDEAVEFCDRLSAHTGRTYRLPSEAEWEYACRAGTTTPFHFGETITPELANYRGTETYNDGSKGEYRQETTPVEHFEIANPFGLCDMHGNVYEWCQDHWHDNYKGAPTDGSAWLSENKDASRVLRGGSWNIYPVNCRSAYRDGSYPRETNNNVGFRVVCSSPRTLQ